MVSRWAACVLLVLVSSSVVPRSQPASPASPPLPVFEDVTATAGIRFVHENGAFGRKYLPETMGSGVAFLDADGDGWQDLLFVNGTTWPGRPASRATMALYRNNHDGTFSDVTARAGLAVPMYGIGVAAADYDNDGRTDIYITAVGQNRLFHNDGDLKFTDVTTRAGVGNAGFSASAAWFDYDRDGRLDLYVANYVEWSPATDITCSLDGTHKSYCTPEAYKGQSAVLYHNSGNGTFQDVTKAAGLADASAKAMGVALMDYDDDGWIDLFVTNDTQPNRLYVNRKNGTFADVAVRAGVAFDDAGKARAGMGVDAGDYDGSGRQSLVIGNFSNEMIALYRNDGHGLFVDEAPRSAIGRASQLTLAFPVFFFDYDLDGRLDIFAGNGHVADDISRVQTRVQYKEPPHLFRNAGKGQFDVVSTRSGAAFQEAVVARGAAYGDVDNDGDLDLVITANGGPARLLRNAGGERNHRLRLKLVSPATNRDAIGARARVTTAAGTSPWLMVKTGSSYASQSELPLTFGLGSAAKVSAIEIRWPDGRTDTLTAVDGDQTLTIEQGRGIVSKRPFGLEPRGR